MQGGKDEMKIKLQDEKRKGNKKIVHEIINQNEMIKNSVTADRNNKSKETQNHQQILKRKIKS